MEEDVIRQIQREGAEALLDVGVSVTAKGDTHPLPEDSFRAACDHETTLYVRTVTYCPDIPIYGGNE